MLLSDFRKCGSVRAGAALLLAVVAMSAESLAGFPTLVPVGDAGNPGELSGYGAGGSGPDRVCGGVGYAFEIQQFEVTAAEYVAFLNAVAADDAYGLYSAQMATHSYGCHITRTGDAGAYTYSVPVDWAQRPVNFVNWGDAARYANWLTNGCPAGAQGPGTTEDGSYVLNGALSDAELLAVVRRPDAEFVIPNEDEWYKAAYYQGAAGGGAYWNYPTQSDYVPSNVLTVPDPGNNANFYQVGYTLGAPYFRSEVGAFSASASRYGTYDQGGNVREWTETLLGSGQLSARGGSCFYGDPDLHANKRVGLAPTFADNDLGFRVARVPEPASLLLALTAALTMRRRAGVN